MLYCMEYESDLVGNLTIASDGENIVGLWMEGQKYFGGSVLNAHAVVSPVGAQPAVFAQARTWLDRYFASNPLPISALPLKPAGTEFRRRVWRVLAAIPYGSLTTYGAIAQKLERETGHRSSARAVGGAVGHNPISIILPCHRVVGANGSLTGFAGGLSLKTKLLEHEGVNLSTLHAPTRGTAL